MKKRDQVPNSFKFALKKSLHKKLDIEMPKHALFLERNPFVLLGYGINAYF